MSVTFEDLRAAVAAGVLTEAQAASVTAIANDRAGKRAAMPAEDEPFEFFRGFSEIFVSIGLIILLSGIAAMLSWFGGVALLSILPLICAGICWWWAGYFTLKRRMNLPSMVLASAFGGGIYLSAITILAQAGLPLRSVVVMAFVLSALGMAAWYRTFRLPFSAFILGLFALGAIYTLTASFESLGGFVAGNQNGVGGFFDLRESPQFATATLVFGIAVFLVAHVVRHPRSRIDLAATPRPPSGCTCWPRPPGQHRGAYALQLGPRRDRAACRCTGDHHGPGAGH
jgi:hypothetical protein